MKKIFAFVTALTLTFSAYAAEREISHYTCSMHPSVRIEPEHYTKDTVCPICAMPLMPVYANADDDAADDIAADVSLNKRQRELVGVSSVPVFLQDVFKEIRTVGTVAYDPKLRSSQEEYLQAKAANEDAKKSSLDEVKDRAETLLEASRNKLLILGFNQELIKKLEINTKADDSLVYPMSTMWVYADVYEYESSWPMEGDEVDVYSVADPQTKLKGVIKALEPILKDKTRSVGLKIHVENTGKLLKPKMYVDVYLKSVLGSVAAIPKSAVIDTGLRKVAYVELFPGKYEMRQVELGPLAYAEHEGIKSPVYPVVSGVEIGEHVVSNGAFLIDSQSQIGAAASAYGGSLVDEDMEAEMEMKGSHGHGH